MFPGGISPGRFLRDLYRATAEDNVFNGAAALLIAASLGFSLYAGHFADYDATYGSIGAVITLMLWLHIAGLVILFGSEISVLWRRYGRSRNQRPLTAKE